MSTYRRACIQLALVLLGATAVAQAQTGMSGMMGMSGGMMDMRGDSAAMSQMTVVHQLLMSHEKITRTVTILPEGILTTTESADPETARRIKAHVADMTARAAASDTTGLPMMSAALRTLLRNGNRIRTLVDTTANGVTIVQTSPDSTTAAALQQHAAEVSELARDGMPAMHRAMMKAEGGMPMSKP